MTARIINPDSTVLQQVDGYWQKLAALIVWKLAGRDTIKITAADMEALQKAFPAGGPVLLTHGHVDSLEFRLIDAAAAERIAAHDASLRGRA